MLCYEIKHPEYSVTMYHPVCQYTVGVGEIWKPKMMDWCSAVQRDSVVDHRPLLLLLLVLLPGID